MPGKKQLLDEDEGPALSEGEQLKVNKEFANRFEVCLLLHVFGAYTSVMSRKSIMHAACAHAQTKKHARAYAHAHARAHTHTHTHTHTQTYTHIQHTRTRTRAHTYTLTHTHTDTHTHTH